MRWIRRLALLLLFIAPALILAGESTVLSTTGPTPIDAASPRGAILAISRQLPQGGMKAALDAYSASSDKEKTSARALARVYLASAKLEAAARQKFGSDVVEEIDHAMRMQSDADLAHARESIDGDHAMIEFSDHSDSLPMIKAEGKWKIDVARVLDPEENSDDFDKGNNALAGVLDRLSQQVQAGEYSNAYLLERAVKQRMFRLLGDEDDRD